MPALKDIEEKYMYGYKVDNENDTAIFNDKDHLKIALMFKYCFISLIMLSKVIKSILFLITIK